MTIKLKATGGKSMWLEVTIPTQVQDLSPQRVLEPNDSLHGQRNFSIQEGSFPHIWATLLSKKNFFGFFFLLFNKDLQQRKSSPDIRWIKYTGWTFVLQSSKWQLCAWACMWMCVDVCSWCKPLSNFKKHGIWHLYCILKFCSLLKMVFLWWICKI